MTHAADTLPPADRRSAFDHAPMGVALCTLDGRMIDANAVLERMLGRSAAELQGVSVFDLMHPDDVPAGLEARRRMRTSGGTGVRLECRLLRADGRPLPVQTTSAWARADPQDPGHVVVFIEDITDRKELEAELVHRSMHDPLTGLPNRILFGDRLRHALERGYRERTPTCLLGIDLDGFKEINDRHGHPVGDQVLVAFAERLRSVLRASDTAARVGGDEFSIVCENSERADAAALAERLRHTLTEPLSIDGRTIPLGISIGISTIRGGTEPETAFQHLIHAADRAMYEDKARRRS